MNAQGMLEQLLKSGLSMIDGKAQAPGARAAGPVDWGQFGAGAAAGGAWGVLMADETSFMERAPAWTSWRASCNCPTA
ncbi:MAG: hypothetical protein H6R06_1521 [Proteobacteria bacterium]|jgi:hypothetical protein|nr:hypothetical protein [Pseudomonadota bacterium]